MNCKREQRRGASVDTEPTPLHPGAQPTAGRTPRPAGTEKGNAPPSAAPQNAPRALAATKPQGRHGKKHHAAHDREYEVSDDQQQNCGNEIFRHSETTLSRLSKMASNTGTVPGLSMPSGHSTAAGQFSENQRIARSNVPVAKSPPSAMSSIFAPRLNTIVERRFRPMPTAAA